jgi:L-threonylcarbamoyladenylate synthase
MSDKLETELVTILETKANPQALHRAASILQSGGLVAFPTETVYGLGANALNAEAVGKIYLAKGRPSDNPLIVHIAVEKALDNLVTAISPQARLLMAEFWPGPLTLVLPRSAQVSDLVTGGLDTVAVRMPNHPVALALLKEAGVPVAAPSANLSGKPSPTTARHVWQDLAGRVEMIIDSGPVGVGVESTVLDLTTPTPMILRPGGVTAEMLEQVLGLKPSFDPALSSIGNTDCAEEKQFIPRSPGMKYTHYSPEARVLLVEGDLPAMLDTIQSLAREQLAQGVQVGIMATRETQQAYAEGIVITVGTRADLTTVAANLYRCLREFDARNVQVILAEGFNQAGLGAAIMNRLTKAAERVIQV